MTRPIVLAAGGTGGHLFPAEALCAQLTRHGRSVALVTDARAAGYESRFSGARVHVVPSGTPSARGVVAKLRAGMDIAAGVLTARRLLRQLDPAAVVGFGGYPSLPTMVAAQRLGLPTIIHEQNAVLGRVNRLVAGRAAAIAASIVPMALLRPSDMGKVSLTGNPVRDAVIATRQVPYALPLDSVELLILGGSQGATVLSEVVPKALAALPSDLRRRLQVTQQCRPEDLDRVGAWYVQNDIKAELASFISDVPQRLARCHLAITRAGASTVAELTVAGRPSILVPYLHATDDHQTANARSLVAAGAARMIPQTGFTPAVLQAALQVLLGDRAAMVAMAAAARSLGRPEAAAALAELTLAHARNGDGHPIARAA
jgi:UDP-N-acetylglucosamine--N-acetylmuramyl-(pentapeptide) pyrophosphoryl-undecaprenol N-acetylglucosamine transferase